MASAINTPPFFTAITTDSKGSLEVKEDVGTAISVMMGTLNALKDQLRLF
jgi:hypothetical protein